MGVSMAAVTAAKIRAQFGLPAPSFSVDRLLYKLYPDVLVMGSQLPEGVEEAVQRNPAGIVILYRRDLSLCARRFALAHAIGHLIFDDVSTARFRGRGGDAESERRADEFAAELLVPITELLRRLHIGVQPDSVGDQRESYLDHVDVLAAEFLVEPALIDQRIREFISAATSA